MAELAKAMKVSVDDPFKKVYFFCNEIIKYP